MDKITYKNARAGLKGTVLVFLAGKRIGTILKLPGGFQYRVKGSTHLHRGAVYPTLEACQQSLAA